MDPEIIGEVSGVETIAVGMGVRDRARLQKRYGRGRWRKSKGVASVRLADGTVGLAEIHWYEAHGIGKRVQVEATIPRQTMSEARAACFAACLDNEGYEASLEVGKHFRVIPHEEAAAHGYTRIVDESGDGYAFLSDRFHPVELPHAVEKTLLAASRP